MKSQGKSSSVALVSEEVSQQSRTFIGQHTSYYFAARMNNALTIVDVASKLAEPAFLIIRPKHYTPDARVVGPTCAHHAGFERYIQCAIVQGLSI
jgi:hypothetical protein